MVTAPTGPPKCATFFHSYREALIWANAISRSGRWRCKVRKYNGEWYAWRVTDEAVNAPKGA